MIPDTVQSTTVELMLYWLPGRDDSKVPCFLFSADNLIIVVVLAPGDGLLVADPDLFSGTATSSMSSVSFTPRICQML